MYSLSVRHALFVHETLLSIESGCDQFDESVKSVSKGDLRHLRFGPLKAGLDLLLILARKTGCVSLP